MGDEPIAVRFELGERRGTGGMGSVYRARDRVTGQTVAVKLLKEERLADRARFEHEAQLLADLAHDAIVRYVAHGRAREGYYLAMEWLDGEDLAERLDRAPLAPADAVAMLARIAEALGVAHARGIVHRDVKPSNIFLPGGDPARAKLLDFGVARSMVGGRPDTQTGTALGTPGYMAPEQARGERDLDARVDVFALGAVLFRCLAGTPPFDAANTIAVLTKVLFDEPPPLSSVRPDLPPAIHVVTALALAKERTARYADGAALARALWDVAPAVALSAAPEATTTGITGGEDRILSSVLVRRDAGAPRRVAKAGPDEATRSGRDQPTVAIGSDADTVLAMRLAGPMRGTFERLADGTWAVVFAGEGATEMATRAGRFALALRDRFPDARIAIATGRGHTGSTITHGAFDRAAQLVTDEAAGTILVDDVTASLVEGRLEVDRGTRAIRLVGEAMERQALRQVCGVVTPFVGRTREVRLLRGVYDGCVEDGRPAAALVIGAPGAGKSRLAAELLVQLEREGAAVWRGYADALAASAPFAPVARILRRALGMVGEQITAASRQTIETRVREVLAGDAATRVVAAITELLDPTARGDAAVDPVALGDQIRRAVEDWTAAEAARAPLVVVLDDVHWADPGTLALFDGVLRNVAGPVFVLAMARPEVAERFPRLWADHGVTTVQLAPLAPAATQQLARAALGAGAGDEVVAQLVDKSAGNPFFLEELVRARAERGASADGGDAGGDAWPETVLATVEARLATLDGDARRLLRAAAVLGQVFWPGAVVHLVGGAAYASAVTSRLELLIEREYVIATAESRFGKERQLAFRHALVRDAAYGTLPDDDRRLAHRLAAEWLESMGEAPAILAEHYERAGTPDAAVPCYVRAAEAALVGDDVAGALALCRRGLAAGADGEARGTLRWLEAEAAWWRGEHARAVTAGVVALATLPARGARWYAALGATAWSAGPLGDTERLVELAGDLLRQPPPDEVRSHAVIAAVKLANFLLFAGIVDGLRKVLAFVQSHAPRLPPGDAATGWVEYLRYLAAMRDGELGRAARSVEKSIAAYAAAGDLRNTCLQRMHHGHVLALIGQYERAEEVLRKSVAEAERLGAWSTLAHAREHLGGLLAVVGRDAEAEALLRAARAAYREHGDARGEATACAELADAWRARPAEAEAVLREGLALAEAHPPTRAALDAQLARLLLARGPADEAAVAEAFTRAAAAYDVIEAGGIVEDSEAVIRLAYVEALEATGRRDDAGTIAWVALQRLRTRAKRLGDPAWEASFLDHVSENAATVAAAARLGVTD